MGYELDMSGESDSFTYWSRKSRKFLERSIGCHAWLIGGSRDASRRTVYRLVSAYTPTEIRDDPKDAKAHIVFGEHGIVFSPPVVLNDFDWFQELNREQNHFSLGFNPVRSPNVRNALQQLLQQHTYPPSVSVPDIEAEEISAREGAVSTRQHLHRERDRTIIAAKRRQVLSATGRLACSVCSFDFLQFYGELGAEFCEVHHLVSLADADGEVQTRLQDLAVVCSNCHRMLHRSHPFLTLEQLKSKIRNA